MECGGQCVTLVGTTMMPELCADNWGTVSMQVSFALGKRLKTSFNYLIKRAPGMHVAGIISNCT